MVIITKTDGVFKLQKIIYNYKMMNAVFFLSGFVGVIGQAVLLREMMAVFQGNELSIGLALGWWMLGVAFGSYTAGRMKIPASKIRMGLAVSFLLAAVFLAAAFFFLRDFRYLFTLIPGVGIGLGMTAAYSFCALFPIGAVIGAQFSLGIRAVEKSTHPSGRVYVWESLGYLAGGLAFTLMAPFVLPARMLSVLVMFCMAPLPLIAARASAKAGFIFLAAVISVPLFFVSPLIEHKTLERMHAGYDVLETVHSPYGQIVVTERSGEKNIIYNGIPVLTLPGRESASAEVHAQLPLLFHPSPDKVLLIGSAGTFIPALEAYQVKQIDYVESDPWLHHLMLRYGVEASWNKGAAAQISVKYGDGRRFLEQSRELYDAVIIGLPYPVTLSLNRFYTHEFFISIKKRLAPGGIVATSVPGSMVHINAPLARLISSVHKTMESALGRVTVISADESTLFVAHSANDGSNRGVPGVDAQRRTVLERFREYGSKSVFLSAGYINYVLDPEKLDRGIYESGIINYDYEPAGLMASLGYWQSLFAPKNYAVYNTAVRFSWVLWLLVLLWFISRRAGYTGTAFSTGAAAMGLQMISIWGLQIQSGHIYYWIGLVSAVFMAGAAAGSWVTHKKLSLYEPGEALLASELVFCLWIIVWWLLFKFSAVPLPAFFAFSAGSGALLGIEFPWLVEGFARCNSGGEGGAAGSIYAADLLGGCAAALIGGTLLIPAWGMERTILLLLVLKAVSSRWWLKRI